MQMKPTTMTALNVIVLHHVKSPDVTFVNIDSLTKVCRN